MVCCLSRWLTYHDKDTNGLPGMLPLAVGMHVALTHKVDESPEKRLLKHSVGRVHSWVWEDGAPHPSVIYLKFEGATPSWTASTNQVCIQSSEEVDVVLGQQAPKKRS